jgi:hypothetical protein
MSDSFQDWYNTQCLSSPAILVGFDYHGQNWILQTFICWCQAFQTLNYSKSSGFNIETAALGEEEEKSLKIRVEIS